ncbi:diguanylate cyclase [Photobacterium leiognathi]|uniref:diguanylate cyclase n=1 Tax=Photobacterium leiognathi TaxID=553611 RepID=UPI002735CD02|nr:diguanylate cyclase [Photobacterium leiognathi]
MNIDHFKKVNDTYGHVARRCRDQKYRKYCSVSAKRQSDIAGRYGGEEFGGVILPGTTWQT